MLDLWTTPGRESEPAGITVERVQQIAGLVLHPGE
jgi:hypothetical protein